MSFLNGKGTFISSIVAIVFGLLLVFGVDLKSYGITEEQISGAVLTLGSVIAIFLRRGSKNDAASSTQATVQAVTGSEAKADIAAATIGTPVVMAVAPAPAGGFPEKPKQ